MFRPRLPRMYEGHGGRVEEQQVQAGRAVLAVVAAALVAGVAPVVASAPAQAACATNTGKSISGTVFGQDGRDVNVSIGFDLVDRNGKALNADPKSAGYGCAKTGGYSVPQSYLNHFVGPEGAPQNSVMKDGNRTTRAWRLGNIPSNAVGAYIEVYSRGYKGSPCKDANGNYCFNPPTVTKYGYANKHLVPIGTQNLPIRLAMTCAYQGTTGNIQGKIFDAAGRPVKVRNVFAWTETKWNAWPFYQGWGSASFPRDGYYVINSLASKQRYTIWLTTADGRTIKRTGVPVSDCKATPLSFRV
ncbi:MAG: hypothetical protein WD794_16165 [Mycobacteriales bacterium]